MNSITCGLDFPQNVYASWLLGLLNWWKVVGLGKPFLIKEICIQLWNSLGNVHSACTCRRRLILLVRIVWEVTKFLATFLKVTNNATSITFGILSFAFFLVFSVVGMSTSKALSLGVCRTGILFTRRIEITPRSGRFSEFLVPLV